MNQLFNIGRTGFLTNVDVGTLLNQKLDWVDDFIRVALVNTTQGLVTEQYTFSNTHDNLADVPLASIIADVALTGRAADATGIATAANATFPTVSSPVGASTTLHADAAIIYRNDPANTTNPATTVGQRNNAILIAYIDTAINIGVIPNGGDITVIWNNGDGKIFRL